MATRTGMSGLLVLAIAIAARQASAQPPPPQPPPAVADPVSPVESPQASRSAVGPTRLFLAPTARTPQRGKGTFALTEIAFPWGEVGVTGRLSLRIFGLPPLGDLSPGGVAIEPKLQLYGGARVRAAVGAVQLLTSSQGDSGGIGYGVVTLGADASVTLGYGYGYGDRVDSEGSRGVLFLGADKALGRHLRLIAEGYLGGAALGLPDQTILGGFRFSSGRFSADFAVVVPFYETGSGTPGPLLTIGWAF